MTVIDAHRGTMFVVRKLVCRGDVRSEKGMQMLLCF